MHEWDSLIQKAVKLDALTLSTSIRQCCLKRGRVRGRKNKAQRNNCGKEGERTI
jgi:hypothetical protein